MLLHEFQPGRAVTGLTMLALSGGYAADWTGAWHAPRIFFVAVLGGGLVLAAAAAAVAYMLRRRRGGRSVSSEKGPDPASSSGSQAMR
ncbi:hypothetical protein OG233_11720 [Streptomyces sp. NBC_01218]|uniref:hypothetical protein n=1 Tax=unclassified Streptomyces TaxID=2593676 RepID=UPI0023B8DC1F|nr:MULTISPECIES: hypothetical protein [unclassified Streptomyces]WEH40101.1 hypothetical protein PZB77_11555 [Streptomyces sp. AM 2-1-1]WSQ51794.1 hypothetical protein OG233_11720 [Streptomyces sp. NBC_01218]